MSNLTAKLNSLCTRRNGPPSAAPSAKALLIHVDGADREWQIAKTGGVWRSNGCRYDFCRLSDLKYQIKEDGGRVIKRAAK